MSYLTLNSLQSTKMTFAKSLNESLGSPTFYKHIFLSYRREDRELVVSIVKFLKNIGSSVYIDYLDNTLEDQTNDAVAQTLRERISSCTKFISLGTPNSGKSKWMPWELGLGDRIVNYKNVAILPVTNSPSEWTDQEYRKIYAHIEKDDNIFGSDINKWFIVYPNGSRMSLHNWLNN